MFLHTLYVLGTTPLLASAICAFDDDDCTNSYSPGTYFGIAAAVFCLIFLVLVSSVIARRRRMRRNKAFMQMQLGGATASGPPPNPGYPQQPLYAPWNRPAVPPSADVNSPYFQPAPPYEPPRTPLKDGTHEPAYPPPSYKQPL
ncbi:hypothetical protein HDZ31DRAFT_28817 [Schizophyllum fasciatum]